MSDSTDLREKIRIYTELTAKINALNKEKEAIKDSLIEYMQDNNASSIISNGVRLKLNSQSKTILDTGKMPEDLYQNLKQKYGKVVRYNTLTQKKVK